MSIQYDAAENLIGAIIQFDKAASGMLSLYHFSNLDQNASSINYDTGNWSIIDIHLINLSKNQ